VKPLQWIGFGLAVVGVKAVVGSYDILADPMGWLLVLLGVRRLATAVRLPAATALGYLGVLAFLCSIPLWWPSTGDRIQHGDPAALWGIGLAELLFSAVLCHALATLAQRARSTSGVVWFRICEAGIVVCTVAPVLYFAAGQSWLKGVGSFGDTLQLVLLVLCFCYSGKTWAGSPALTPPEDTADGKGTTRNR